MFAETVPNRDSLPTVLIRHSNREGRKVRKRTLANITKASSRGGREHSRRLTEGRPPLVADAGSRSGTAAAKPEARQAVASSPARRIQ